MIILQKREGKIGIEPNLRPLEQRLKYGILVVDKPQGPSSHEVSAFARKILNLTVTGHTGTLDQNVSGVLVVLLEHSRKVVNFIPNTNKTYVCLMRLEKPVKQNLIEDAFSNFRGEIYQRPPLESAVARKLRIRKVYELNILEISQNMVLFECRCEAGTYIRKIVSDLGEVLGVKAGMAELRRTVAGDFSQKKAITLAQLSDYFWLWKEKGDEAPLKAAIAPIETLTMKKIVISDDAAQKIKHGIKPKISDVCALDANIHFNEKIGLYTLRGELIAMAEALLVSSDIVKFEKDSRVHEEVARISRVIHEF